MGSKFYANTTNLAPSLGRRCEEQQLKSDEGTSGFSSNTRILQDSPLGNHRKKSNITLKKAEENNKNWAKKPNIIQNRKTIAKKINKTKIWFFEKINKSDKPLARLRKEKGEKTQITNIRNVPWDIKRMIKECMNNSILTNLIIYMRCTHSLKDTNYQNSHKES